jgi:cytochrome d ubiquinol oxidase subunit I
MKIAAIEAMWETEPAPAGFALFGIPDLAEHKTHAEIKIPWVLGLIATRSLDTEVPGIDDLLAEARTRITSGIAAHAALQRLRRNPGDADAAAQFEAHKADLGYGLLLLKQTDNPAAATEAQIAIAAASTIPNVPVLFWSFRVMVLLGFSFIALFGFAFWLSAKQQLERYRWFLRAAFCALPLPWVALELGWIVAEYGRQPWAIEGVLPTFLGVSATAPSNVALSLAGFVVFYTVLAIIEGFLMVRMIRRGPDGLGYWPPSEHGPAH